MEIGTRIREIRLSNNLKINELSSQVGISRVYLSDIERNVKLPTLELLQKICSALKIPMSVLFADDSSLSPQLQNLINNAQHLTDKQLSILNEFLKSLLKD